MTAVVSGREGQAYLFSGPRGARARPPRRESSPGAQRRTSSTASRVASATRACRSSSARATTCTNSTPHRTTASTRSRPGREGGVGPPGAHKVYILDECPHVVEGGRGGVAATPPRPPSTTCGPRRGCTPCAVPACRARPSDQITNRVDAVVGGGVEFVHVVAGAELDRRHESHSQHGSPSTTLAQLSTLARIRAEVVLPVPRWPQNRTPCPSRPEATASRNARTTWSCPLSSLKRRGRYRR